MGTVRHQYGISALVSQASFGGKTSGSVAKCGLFSQAAIRHLHISHNAPYLPPQIFHNLCFSFLLSILAVPREMENNMLNAKLWGQIRCIMGDVQVANIFQGCTEVN